MPDHVQSVLFTVWCFPYQYTIVHYIKSWTLSHTRYQWTKIIITIPYHYVILYYPAVQRGPVVFDFSMEFIFLCPLTQAFHYFLLLLRCQHLSRLIPHCMSTTSYTLRYGLFLGNVHINLKWKPNRLLPNIYGNPWFNHDLSELYVHHHLTHRGIKQFCKLHFQLHFIE